MEHAAPSRPTSAATPPTSQIEALWDHLRDDRLGGLSFRRHVPVDDMIADFYCPDLRLAVVMDPGAYEDDLITADGIYVMHLRNGEVVPPEPALRRIREIARFAVCDMAED